MGKIQTNLRLITICFLITISCFCQNDCSLHSICMKTIVALKRKECSILHENDKKIFNNFKVKLLLKTFVGDFECRIDEIRKII